MFYTYNVDICSVKSMWNFLKNHPTYSTLNSWNHQSSIAHNVKLYKLNLDGYWYNVLRFLQDEGDIGGLQLCINDELRDFEHEYPGCRVGFNGRSGGYLVLYNSDNYRSVLPDCVDQFDTYEDFKEDAKTYGYTVSEYLYELRQMTEIVRAFDKLCDNLRDLCNDYSTRSYDDNLLVDVLERFECQYFDDLESLKLKGPELINGRIKLNDIEKYNSFMTCFLNLFGEDRRRVTRVREDDGYYIYLEED